MKSFYCYFYELLPSFTEKIYFSGPWQNLAVGNKMVATFSINITFTQPKASVKKSFSALSRLLSVWHARQCFLVISHIVDQG